jgi:hypothetical protein
MMIRILGMDYQVHEVAELGEAGTAGAVDNQLHILFLGGDRSDMPPGEAAEIMLHEIIHAIDYRLNLGLEESQVHRLSAALYAVISDNPGVFDG